jgi:replicative DNA helicase
MSDPLAQLVDLALERNLLGQALGFNLCRAFEEAGLTRAAFSREAHRLIWDAAMAVQDGGGDADLVTVGSQLHEFGQLDEVGAAYFSALVDGVVRPAPVNLRIEVAYLQDLAAGREAHYAARRLQADLAKPGALADGVVVKHLDTVQAILERQQGSKAAPWHDVESQLRAHQEETALVPGQRVYLGLPTFDEAIGGIRRGEVCGLLGRPGIGKTVLVCHVARVVTEHVGHVLFSLEMPVGQIVGRNKQMVYGIGRHGLEEATRRGEIDDAPYRHAFQHLVIVDTPGLSVAEMGRHLRQIAKGPLKDVPVGLVTIDHLGLVGGDRQLSTYDRVSTQSRDIKELAKRHGVAVLLAVQVSREAGGDGSRELGLSSARDSGVVEEAMDYMIAIRRLDRSLTLNPIERARYRDVIFAKLVKNRHGDPGHREVAYRFHPVGLQLVEDTRLEADDNDIARIAAARSGGRR